MQFFHLINLVHEDPAMLQQISQLQADAQASLTWEIAVINARDKSFNDAATLVGTGNLKKMMDWLARPD
ncbi:MAG: hypothetical protein WDN00_07365 [Limisphaerales bacterium]